MYAFEALKAELEQVDELHFIFTLLTSPSTAEEVTDKIRKERKEFHIPNDVASLRSRRSALIESTCATNRLSAIADGARLIGAASPLHVELHPATQPLALN